ncbi:TonB-dependent receptor plug domain-containing protein [Zhouia sp. PK063]|uniref:TonB-dependent receptor plug domain-containing protein n=1 Tax=Zhouia sp. PK063 TaxID=3373602 RepID=UPI0037A46B9A
MRIKFILLGMVLCLSYSGFSQVDSTHINHLKEVEVVGTPSGKGVNQNVFKVTTISHQQIENFAGNNLADILTQNLNISVTPNSTTGRSTISMFGLSGDYVKILVDNVPLVSDNGYGNDIDITQINLDDVERVEVVEGAMGVLYGDNAVAGIINIITKKGIRSTWKVTAAVQEETVGKEYHIKNKGRHIQQLTIAHNITKHWFTSAGISHTVFNGFYNSYFGKNYFGTQGNTIVNDSLRGYEWNPKQQLNTNALLRYSTNSFQVFYKFNYYNEDLDIYDHSINSRVENGSYVITATDENYLTNRFSHQLQISGTFFNQITYNVSASYQQQVRDYKNYVYNIGERRETAVVTQGTNQSSKLFFSKGTLSHLFASSKWIYLTSGYEIVNQKGYDVTASGNYSSAIAEQKIDNYDVFSQAQLMLSKRLEFYPGIRLNNNSNYNSHFIWSATTNYQASSHLEFKAVLGSAYKTPTFSQLYYYFVDANHNVQGNPNLQPEDGISVLFSADKKWKLGKRLFLNTSLKGFHFNIKDKIALIVVDDNAFAYENINTYKVLGVSLEHNINYKHLNVGLGINYTGVAQQLNAEAHSNGDYLYTLNMNALASYYATTLKTTFSTQLKYNGKFQQYVIDNSSSSYYKGYQEAYTLLDASIKKTFLKDQLEVTLGARNLLNVVQVNTNLSQSTAHEAAPTSTLFGYGRSYFIKLAYHLNL